MEIEYKEINKRPRFFSRDVTPIFSGRNLNEEDLNIYEIHELLHVWYSDLKDKDKSSFINFNDIYMMSSFMYNNFKICRKHETSIDSLKNTICSYCAKEPCAPIDVCHMLVDKWNSDDNNESQEIVLKDKDNNSVHEYEDIIL